MNKTTVIQGRRISPEDIELIKKLIDTNPSWGRTRLSKELCILWNFKSAKGSLKDMSCRNLLLKLQKQKLLTLPDYQKIRQIMIKEILPSALSCIAACLFQPD